MLRELRISNFIIIEDQTIPFGAGFNAISGESGSGKSVVLQALEFVLGRRSSASLIRPGCEGAEVQALFDLTELPERVRQELPDAVNDLGSQELLLSRTLSSSGRARVHVNGKLGTVGLLEEIGKALLTVSSQREHMRLLEPQYHLDLIDSVSSDRGPLERYREIFDRWAVLRREVTAIEEKITRSVFRRAELESVVAELGEAKLTPGIRAELEAEVKRIGAGEMLLASGQEVVELLRGEEGATGVLRTAVARLSELARHDPELSELATRLGTLRTEVDEAGADLNRYISAIELNEERLSELRERLAEVARLERKYRAPDAALCELLDQSRAELAAIEDPDSLETLKVELAALEQKLSAAAEQLSALRRKNSRSLVRSLEKELAELGMAEAKITLRHEMVPFANCGIDRIELLIAVNKGSEPAPLKAVASGGELSRFFLASKVTVGGKSGTPSLVFDEVDTGVSGKTARVVGHKLRSLSAEAQVICITHLPQVASLADQHFTVEKRTGKVASSIIRELSEDEKVNEIARMIAGFEITGAAKESAKELLSSKTTRG
jgi:DNA repair protein RecN (Recombination protein N)